MQKANADETTFNPLKYNLTIIFANSASIGSSGGENGPG